MTFGIEIDDLASVPAAVHMHRLVVVRGAALDLDEQVDLAASVGTVVGSTPHLPQVRYEDDLRREPSHRFLNERWHADLSWCEEGPAVTLLQALVAGPRAAATSFADTVSGFAALPEQVREEIAGWSARHHVERSRQLRYGHGSPPRRRTRRRPAPQACAAVVPTHVAEPGASHPVVQLHHASGRRGVLLGDHAWMLDGFDLDEGRTRIDDLQAGIVAGGERYQHQWRPGDLVVFDNRTVLHRREPAVRSSRRRVLRRTVAWPSGPAGDAASRRDESTAVS